LNRFHRSCAGALTGRPLYDRENFQTLIADAAALEREIDAILPALASARRNYAKSRSEADRVEMDRVQGLAEDLAARHPALSDDLSRASGLPDEVLEALDAPLASLDSKNRVRRDDLNGAEVRSTGSVDDYLADAIETVERSLPAGWSEAEAGASHRLDALFAGECLSLVKGLRPGSELAPLHRMRQMLRVARDYLADQPAYDHFAGALLVPTLAQLGAHLPSLAQVGGDVSARIGKLAETGGASTDATVLELLVAARCAEMGRRIEFLDETQERSPDIRCHDPFPMQIECKRKRALSDYEIAEEAAMRAVFLALEREASSKGLTGRFDLQLNVEVRSNLTTEIVTRLISQRLAPHPERALHYEWGTVAYHPIPRRVPLPGMTRLRYSGLRQELQALANTRAFNNHLKRERNGIVRFRADCRAAYPCHRRPPARAQGGTGRSSIRSRSEYHNRYYAPWHVQWNGAHAMVVRRNQARA
jgi:hypothetical protein